MAEAEHLEVVARGALEIAQWRDMHPAVALDLTGAALEGALLESADLSDADLSGACLDRADLRGAKLCRAILRQASLDGADLSDADLMQADLTAASLQSAELSRAAFEDADLTGADLSGAFAIDAEFTRTRLARVNLTSAHLTRARLIEADLTDAVVENSVVTGTLVENLQGCPQTPEVLWFDDEPRTLITDSGVLLVINDPATPVSPDRARSFFVQPQTVELVWERSFPEAAVLAYSAFQLVARAAGAWPAEVRFVAGVTRRGRMVFLYEASSPTAVVAGLRALLEPFGVAAFIDFSKTASAWSRLTGEAIRVQDIAHHAERSAAAQLLRAREGFADNLPVELRTAEHRTAIEFRARPAEGPAAVEPGTSTGTIDFEAGNAPQPPQPGRPLQLELAVAERTAESPGASAVRFVATAGPSNGPRRRGP